MPTTSDAQPDAFDLTISFAAGGWFQMYHFGVCKAMIDSGFLSDLQQQGKKVRFCGSSAGALAASSLASGCYMHDEMKDFALICGEHFRESWLHVLCMREYLIASIHRFGDRMMETDEQREKTLHGMRNGRLEIYTTTLPLLRPKCLTSFADMDDLEEALVASCCLTPLVGLPFPLRESGEWVCDGGVRAFQPRKGQPNTLTVSPFYFTSADIHPSQAVPVWWGLMPPRREEHEELFYIGYNDCIEYLVTAGLVPKARSTLLVALKRATTRGARRGGVVQLMADASLALLYVAVLRPLSVIAIYVEMVVVGAVLAVLFLTSALHKRGRSSSMFDWRPIYETFRNVVSLRLFLRLLFGYASWIPVNEARLVKRSRLYRALQPLVFERGGRVRPSCSPPPSHARHAATQSETPKKRRFMVDTYYQMKRHWVPPAAYCDTSKVEDERVVDT